MEQRTADASKMQHEEVKQAVGAPAKLELRPYQEEGVRYIAQQRNLVIALPMRSGKTLIALEGVKRIFQENYGDAAGPQALIILAPRSALYVWEEHIKQYVPELMAPHMLGPVVVVEGPQPARYKLWHSSPQYSGIFITTYNTYQLDASNPNMKLPGALKHRSWGIIMDEIHRKCRKHRTKSFQFLEGLVNHPAAKHATVLVSSGTLVRKGPQDLWPPLHLVAPKKFKRYWAFVNEYCLVADGEFGKEILGLHPGKRRKFQEDIRPHIMHRTRAELMPELPAKIRQRLPVTMTPVQEKLYRTLEKDLFASIESSDNSPHALADILVKNPLALGTRLRQLLVCPQQFEGVSDPGGGLEAILDHAQNEEINTFAIFTPFVQAIPHIERYIRTKAPKASIHKIYGGIPAEDVRNITKSFNAAAAANSRESDPEAPLLVAILSIEFAQGFDLRGARVGYFLGSSWNADDDEQAEDRLLVMDPSIDPAAIYYVTYKNTVDDRILEVVSTKSRESRTVLGTLRSDP